MSKLHVQFKRMSKAAVPPVKAKKEDAGWDIGVAIKEPIRKEGDKYTCIVDTGIATAFSHEWVAIAAPRSGSGFKHHVAIANTIGVIDSGYRDSIKLKLTVPNIPASRKWLEDITTGDRVAQLLFLPVPDTTMEEVDELPPSVRGADGFGSSGLKQQEA